jgi:hypothetical protein
VVMPIVNGGFAINCEGRNLSRRELREPFLNLRSRAMIVASARCSDFGAVLIHLQ